MMIELGLSRVHRLLANHSLTWRAIHVAGTNGKGSICAYISSMLEHYNSFQPKTSPGPITIRHGRFTSPHLVERRDCITINEDMVTRDVFARVETDVLRLNREHDIKASEFELLTATAFNIFSQLEVDVGVVEVGMGGRLDATNVIGQQSTDFELDGLSRSRRDIDESRPTPLVTAISSIGLDHQAFLGSTIAEIAGEKAGIIKAGVPVVYADEDSDVCEAIEQKALEIRAGELLPVTRETSAHDIWVQCNYMDDYRAGKLPRRPVQVRWSNGAVALQSAWIALKRLGRLDNMSTTDMVQLLGELASIPEQAVWPGRLQVLSAELFAGDTTGEVILDGAHNVQSARVLRRFVDERQPNRKVLWVVAMSKGKDVEQMLRVLLKPGDAVMTASFGPVDGMPWVQTEDITVVSRIAEGMGSEIVRFDDDNNNKEASGRAFDLMAALRRAWHFSKLHDRQLVIAGSLYLAGDVLRRLRQGEKQDRH